MKKKKKSEIPIIKIGPVGVIDIATDYKKMLKVSENKRDKKKKN